MTITLSIHNREVLLFCGSWQIYESTIVGSVCILIAQLHMDIFIIKSPTLCKKVEMKKWKGHLENDEQKIISAQLLPL